MKNFLIDLAISFIAAFTLNLITVLLFQFSAGYLSLAIALFCLRFRRSLKKELEKTPEQELSDTLPPNLKEIKETGTPILNKEGYIIGHVGDEK